MNEPMNNPDTSQDPTNPWRSEVLENALDAVVGVDSEDTVIDWNLNAEKIFGFSKAEVLGRNMSQIIIPEKYRAAHIKGRELYLSTGIGPILNRRIELEALHKNGEVFPIELTVIPIEYKGTQCFYSFIRDISEKKMREKELVIKSEVIEHSLNGIDIIDENGNFIYANRAYVTMWGYNSQDEILGTSPESHCADPSTPEKIIKELKDKGECEMDFIARRKDGSFFDVRMWSRLAHDSAGKEIYPTTSIDITEQKKSREALKTSEELYHSTFDLAPIGIINTDPQGRLLNVNKKLCQMLGYTSQELKSLTFNDITHPEDRSEDQVLFKQLKEKTIDVYDREKRYIKKDGTPLWVQVTGQMLSNPDGTPKHSITIVQDISVRKRAEEQKEKLESQLRILSDLSIELLSEPLGYAERLKKFVAAIVPELADWCAVDILNEKGIPELVAVTHVEPEKIKLAFEIRKKYFQENPSSGAYHVIKTRKPELVSDISSSILKSMTINDEHFKLLSSLGLKSYICVPILAHGEVQGALTLVSETKSYSESDLQFAQQLSNRAALALYNSRLYNDAKSAIQARDEFLSIASHELKTPLTSLKLLAQFQDRLIRRNDLSVYSKEKTDNYNEKTQYLIERLERLVDDMLDISRIRTGQLSLQKERINLCEMIRELAQRIKSVFGSHSASRIHTSGLTECYVMADPLRIEQVISNIFQNALKYGNGKDVQVYINSTANSIIVSVKDQGIGIPIEVQEKIFDRFERAVNPNEISGLGLGLFISRKIMEAHNGAIWAESEVGEGSTFYIEFSK